MIPVGPHSRGPETGQTRQWQGPRGSLEHLGFPIWSKPDEEHVAVIERIGVLVDFALGFESLSGSKASSVRAVISGAISAKISLQVAVQLVGFIHEPRVIGAMGAGSHPSVFSLF